MLMPSVARALLVVVQPSAAAVREVSPQLLERAWKEAAAAAAAAGEVEASLPTQVCCGYVGYEWYGCVLSVVMVDASLPTQVCCGYVGYELYRCCEVL